MSDQEQQIVRRILADQEEAFIFGSRAKGNHRQFSDLDICIKNATAVPDHVLSMLKSAFQESDLPYTVDIVDFNKISDDFRSLIMGSSLKLK
jgi:predicted nucleotidyltransferase